MTDKIVKLLLDLDLAGDFRIKKDGAKYKVTILSSGAGARSDNMLDAIEKCLLAHERRKK